LITNILWLHLINSFAFALNSFLDRFMSGLFIPTAFDSASA